MQNACHDVPHGYNYYILMEKKKKKISLISKLNYFRLFYRSALMIGCITWYIIARVRGVAFFDRNDVAAMIIVGFITLSFAIEMLERFFPAKTSSMGSQKQFARNYRPSGETKPELMSWKRTLVVFLSWVALNAVFAVLYFTHVIDEGALCIISAFYTISDLICILFFCPFQTWMMKNRCCTTCRIYNWDFAMMFTPLIFLVVVKEGDNYVPNAFAILLVSMSLLLLLRWEVTYKMHPERFSDKTNLSMRCVNCKEKLCSHKKQLQKLLRDSAELAKKTGKQGAEFVKKTAIEGVEFAKKAGPEIAEFAKKTGPQIAEFAKKTGKHGADFAKKTGKDSADFVKDQVNFDIDEELAKEAVKENELIENKEAVHETEHVAEVENGSETSNELQHVVKTEDVPEAENAPEKEEAPEAEDAKRED